MGGSRLLGRRKSSAVARRAEPLLMPWSSLLNPKTIVEAVIVLIAGSLVGMLYFDHVGRVTGRISDIPLHIDLLVRSRETSLQLGYTIYYQMLDLVSGGAADRGELTSAAALILGVSMGLRLTLLFLLVILARQTTWLSVLVAVCVTVAAPLTLPGTDPMYLGKFSPSVWHNSTTILALPLCLALFVAVVKVLSCRNVSTLLYLSVPVLTIVCGAVKPNYLLALGPAVAIWCVVQVVIQPRGDRASTFRRLLARVSPLALAAVATLGYQYLATFGGSGITILGQVVTNQVRPMAVWRLLTPNPAWALVASFLWPALATGLLNRRTLSVGLAWLVAVCGVVEFVLLAEVLSPSGSTLGHANWIWGAHMATFVLYAVVAQQVAAQWHLLSRARWVLLALGLYQTLLGVRIVVRFWAGEAPTRMIGGWLFF